MFNAIISANTSPTPKKAKKEAAPTPLQKVLQMLDPNGVLVADAVKYQKRMSSVEDSAKRGFQEVAIRKRYVPDYVTTGYQAANAAKALRARFEGDFFWFCIHVLYTTLSQSRCIASPAVQSIMHSLIMLHNHQCTACCHNRRAHRPVCLLLHHAFLDHVVSIS